jgi:capsid protein
MALRRLRARVATDNLIRHYESAGVGRRTQNWNRSAGDANAVNGNAALSRLREVARDLVRNNPYAESALNVIADHTVGYGIVAKAAISEQARAKWKAWSETTACDADGRNTLAGLQKLFIRTIGESGEVLVRRRPRLVEDGLPIPLQLQILEPDLIDSSKSMTLPNGGQIIQGIEFDPSGTASRTGCSRRTRARRCRSAARSSRHRGAFRRRRSCTDSSRSDPARCARSRGSRRSSCG